VAEMVKFRVSRTNLFLYPNVTRFVFFRRHLDHNYSTYGFPQFLFIPECREKEN
jgi:hypothetical protein